MSDGIFATPISKNDDLNSNTNPIYVSNVDTPEVITPVHNYKTSVLALNATANHDYTCVGSKFRLKK